MTTVESYLLIFIGIVATLHVICIVSCYNSEKAIQKLEEKVLDLQVSNNKINQDLFELCNLNRDSINDAYVILKRHNELSIIHEQLIENNCTQIQLLNDMDTNQNKLIIELKKQLNDTRAIRKEKIKS